MIHRPVRHDPVRTQPPIAFPQHGHRGVAQLHVVQSGVAAGCVTGAGHLEYRDHVLIGMFLCSRKKHMRVAFGGPPSGGAAAATCSSEGSMSSIVDTIAS